MSDQLDITKLTAEEVAKLYPEDEKDGDISDIYSCNMRSGDKYDFFCTRPDSHAGPHVAYGGGKLPYAIWYSGGDVKLLFDE